MVGSIDCGIGLQPTIYYLQIDQDLNVLEDQSHAAAGSFLYVGLICTMCATDRAIDDNASSLKFPQLPLSIAGRWI